MAYDGVIMQRALARFDQARQRRAAEMEQRRRMLYARQPRLEEIERTLRGTMSRIVAAAAKKGEDPLPAIRALRDENLALQQERAQLLTELGYPADYLEDKPACPLCGDTGYDKKGVCRCLRQYYAREQLQELSRLLPLGEARFETFRFDLYDSAEWEGYGISPRANMERNFDVCRDFACQFSRGGGDLLLSGGTGLGKTFLSACIARVVSESGFSVVYDTAISIFAKLENDKFRPDEETAKTRAQYIEQLQSRIMDEWCQEKVGASIEVLCEGFDDESGLYYGRSQWDSPDIDSRVWFTGRDFVPGEFVQVAVTAVRDGELQGAACQEE